MSEVTVQWEHVVESPENTEDDTTTRYGRAGLVMLTQTPAKANACTACAYKIDPFEQGGSARPTGTWRQCGMPPFGTVDLETADVPPFEVCFAHLHAIASVAPYIPLRPLSG